MPVPDDWEPQNEWIQAVKAKGRTEGLTLGRQEGRQEGEAKGLAKAILGFLRSRRIAPTEEERATILSCTDQVTLERWISRVATAQSAADLFADD